MEYPSESNCKLKDLDGFENMWFDLTQHDCLRMKADVLMQQGFAQKKKKDDPVVKIKCKQFFSSNM